MPVTTSWKCIKLLCSLFYLTIQVGYLALGPMKKATGFELHFPSPINASMLALSRLLTGQQRCFWVLYLIGSTRGESQILPYMENTCFGVGCSTTWVLLPVHRQDPDDTFKMKLGASKSLQNFWLKFESQILWKGVLLCGLLRKSSRPRLKLLKAAALSCFWLFKIWPNPL